MMRALYLIGVILSITGCGYASLHSDENAQVLAVEQISPPDYFGDPNLEVAICVGSNGRGCLSMDGRYEMPRGSVVRTGNITGIERSQDAVYIYQPGMPEGCCWFKPSTFAPGKDFPQVRDKLRGRWQDSTVFGWNVIILQASMQQAVQTIEQHGLWPRCYAKLDSEMSGGGRVDSPKVVCSFMYDTADWRSEMDMIRSCPKSGGPHQYTGKDYVCINWWQGGADYF